MVMLNVPAEVAERLRAYAQEHDLDDASALAVLLNEEAARRKSRRDPLETLMRVRATLNLEELEGAFDDVRDRSPGRTVDL